jgi:hypothetical protein
MLTHGKNSDANARSCSKWNKDQFYGCRKTRQEKNRLGVYRIATAHLDIRYQPTDWPFAGTGAKNDQALTTTGRALLDR